MAVVVRAVQLAPGRLDLAERKGLDPRELPRRHFRAVVRHATETLVAGDVVTLEPGLYVDGVGGIRIEHNYLVTDGGFERLSGHTIALQ